MLLVSTFMIGFFSYYKHIIPRWSLHLACARLGDVALFGELVAYFIFAIKLVMYIVTQLIKINVTRRTQDMRESPAHAHLGNQWLIK